MKAERLRHYLSPDAIRRAVREIIARFPFAIAYLTLLCAWLVTMVYHSFDLSRMLIESVTWPLCEGVLLSVAAALWCEYMRPGSRALPVQLVVLCFVIVDCLALVLRGGVSDISEYIGRWAIVTALFIAVIFLPSAPGLNRKQLWHYSLWQFGAMAAGVALAAVLAIAILLIFGTIGALFGFDSWKVLYTFEILLAVYVPVLFYLSRMPRRDVFARANDLDDVSPIGAFCKNVLLPLVGVYTLILYVYGAKILFTWKLPTDSISVMVTGLMSVSLVMLYGLQHYTFGENTSETARKIASLARTILPVALLPLLVLMSVGVIYRVGEYGLTASRLYVITFNLWAYGVILYLILRKNANLNIIAGTFAVVFVLVSIIPGFNLTAIATRNVRAKVMLTIRATGVETLPISYDKLVEIIGILPKQEGRNLASQLEYLDDYYDHSRVADIVQCDHKLSTWLLVKDDDEVEVTAVELTTRDYNGGVNVPAGYVSVEYRHGYKLDAEVNVDSIYAANRAEMVPVFVVVNDSTAFTITRLHRYGPDNQVEYSGYEFKK